MKKKILILSHDKIGSQMAGPGIRYHYVGEVLAEHFDVTIGFFDPTYLPDDAFRRSYSVKHIDVHQYQQPFLETDYIFTLWLSDAMMHFCNQHKKIVVFDIYAPVPVENLAVQVFSHKPITPEIDYEYGASLKMYKKFLQQGDLFAVSNRRQLDFWLGYIFGAEQVLPSTYKKDPILDRFIYAPMGIDTKLKMTKQKQLYKGVVPGIAKDDILVIWNGGIYDWYDAGTLMEAMKILWDKNQRHIKLVFPGLKHPNANTPKWAETVIARDKAAEFGLTDRTVYFFDSWFDYHERLEYLLEADLTVYSHKPSIESEFSHRSRVIDHILTRLPTVATDGDYFADVIREHNLGLVVPPQNPPALADALLQASDKQAIERFRANIDKVRPDFDWHQTLKPLVEYFLSNPQKVTHPSPSNSTPLETPRRSTLKRLMPRPIKKIAKRILGKLR